MRNIPISAPVAAPLSFPVFPLRSLVSTFPSLRWVPTQPTSNLNLLLKLPVSCLPSFLPTPEMLPPLIPALERKMTPGKDLEVRVTDRNKALVTWYLTGGESTAQDPSLSLPQPLLSSRVGGWRWVVLIFQCCEPPLLMFVIWQECCHKSSCLSQPGTTDIPTTRDYPASLSR